MSYQMYSILWMRMQQNYFKKRISYLLEYIGLNQNMTNILESIPKDKIIYASKISLNLSRDHNEDRVSIIQQSGLVFAIFIGFGIVFIKVFHDAVSSHAISPKPTHPISIVSWLRHFERLSRLSYFKTFVLSIYSACLLCSQSFDIGLLPCCYLKLFIWIHVWIKKINKWKHCDQLFNHVEVYHCWSPFLCPCQQFRPNFLLSTTNIPV